MDAYLWKCYAHNQSGYTSLGCPTCFWETHLYRPRPVWINIWKVALGVSWVWLAIFFVTHI